MWATLPITYFMTVGAVVIIYAVNSSAGIIYSTDKIIILKINRFRDMPVLTRPCRVRRPLFRDTIRLDVRVL